MKYLLLFKRYILTFIFLITFFNFSFAQCDKGGNQDGQLGDGGYPYTDSKKNTLLEWVVTGVLPFDPNEISGPAGYAEKKWVSVKDKLGYTIYFENNGEFASAAAQNVFIHFPVDTNININSFRLGDYSFGQYNFEVPENTTFYSKRLDLRDSLNLYVDVTAGIDIVKHEFFWIFKSIDPVTGRTPTDLRGFLPVSDTGAAKLSDSTNKGKGFVRFSANPQSYLITGDSVKATASIVFDINETIPTNTWVNFIDAFAPTSKINSADVLQNVITLHWSGNDDAGGTGVRDYDIYVSENSDTTFKTFLTKVTGTSADFTGTPGSIYRFFTIATDNVGNRETLKKGKEIEVELTGIVLPVKWLYFTGQQKGNDVMLNWATVNELNTKEFIVERSLNGRDFAAIGKVTATGNSTQTHNYSYPDKDATLLKISKLYYRLQQVDKDGKIVYSKVVLIPVSILTQDIVIIPFPNPFKNIITLQILNVAPTDIANRATLRDVTGKVVYDRKMEKVGQSTILLEGLRNDLAAGIYFLQVSINGKMYNVKMIKE